MFEELGPQKAGFATNLHIERSLRWAVWALCCVGGKWDKAVASIPCSSPSNLYEACTCSCSSSRDTSLSQSSSLRQLFFNLQRIIVYAWVGICVHMCVGACACVCVWRTSRQLHMLFLRNHPPWLLRQGLPLVLRDGWWGWSSWPGCLPLTGIVRLFHPCSWEVGFKHSSMLIQQVLTERAVASAPTFKAKVSFYGFILSDEGLIEVAWKYVLDYRCLLWKAYSILSDAKISFP